MPEAVVTSRWERDGGCIEMLEKSGCEVFYRSCAHGMCRYSSDRWQAELYLDHLLAIDAPFSIQSDRVNG